MVVLSGVGRPHTRFEEAPGGSKNSLVGLGLALIVVAVFLAKKILAHKVELEADAVATIFSDENVLADALLKPAGSSPGFVIHDADSRPRRLLKKRIERLRATSRNEWFSN